MKAMYRITDHRLLMEASAGELFATLGPHLTECVCAVRAEQDGDGFRSAVPNSDRLNPNALVPVVVVACRVEADSPEYYPSGYETALPGASPIVFLAQAGDLRLVPREVRGFSDAALAAIARDVWGDGVAAPTSLT